MAKKESEISVESKLQTLYQLQATLSAIDEKRALRILKGNAGEDVSPIKKHGVAALVKAIQSSDCLWGSITKYYGERVEVSCGHCTQCRRKNNIA